MKSKNKIVLAEDYSVLSLIVKSRLEKEGFKMFLAKN
ncbi:MAG: hypothetical protein ACJA1B_001967 [Polaribacter sp.]|jgi:hypothetical protein